MSCVSKKRCWNCDVDIPHDRRHVGKFSRSSSDFGRRILKLEEVAKHYMYFWESVLFKINIIHSCLAVKKNLWTLKQFPKSMEIVGGKKEMYLQLPSTCSLFSLFSPLGVSPLLNIFWAWRARFFFSSSICNEKDKQSFITKFYFEKVKRMYYQNTAW